MGQECDVFATFMAFFAVFAVNMRWCDAYARSHARGFSIVVCR